MRLLFKLLVAGLIARAVWQVGPVYWDYTQFKDAAQSTAQFAGARSAGEIAGRVVELAREYDVPLDPADVRVRKERDHVYIDASYTAQLELLPRMVRPWRFVVSVDAWTTRPTRASDVIR
jgi:hypothetical protein